MFAPELAASSVWHAITLALVHFLWQGVAIAAGLAILVELLHLRRPQTRYACSLVALLLMAACPGITLWFAEGPEARSQEPGARSQRREVRSHAPWTISHAAQPLDAINAAQPYVLLAWLAGVGFFACRLLMGMIGVRKLRRGRLPLPRELAERAARLGRPLGLRAESLVFLSRNVAEAMAVGLVKPIVLIPAAWATEMPLAMLEAVIAHELAHLQRRDLWVNLLQRIVETLLFYHPAVWWLSRRLRAERELCCDELAVALTGRRLEYVQALETVARRTARVEPLLAAGIRGERNMQLLARVRNVLGLSAAADRSRLWPAGLIALLLPLVAWGWSSGFIAPQPAAAIADDDRDDDADDREEREVDGDKKKIRKEIRRDGDDDDDARGKGDREKEGRESDEAKFFHKKEIRIRVDGDKKDPGPKDGEIVKKPARKDGDVVRKPGPKDGEIVKKPGPKDSEEGRIIHADADRMKIELKRRVNEDDRIAELMTMVKKLTAENERLQAELFKLRGGKQEDSSYEEAAREKYKRAAAEKVDAEYRKRKLKELESDDREGTERKELRSKLDGAGGEKEATLKEAWAKEVLLRDLAEKVRDQAIAAEEQARAAARKAEDQARRAAEDARKAVEDSRDEKRQ
jgi:beta-lactamase regulating signal transducer with metallopeptidase domain